MEGSRVIDNLELDRLREENVTKEEGKRQKDAARDGLWGVMGGDRMVPEGWGGDWYQGGR